MSRPRLIILFLALGTLAIYLPVRHYHFILFDDDDYITNNPIVQSGLTWANLKWAFATWNAGNWHPLTWLSHMLDCQLFGLAAGPHHCVNVLLHLINSVLLFALLRRLTGAHWPSAFVAALFAWHPLHVESVAWVAERKDVLSTCFALLALLSYAQFAKLSQAKNSNSKIHYALALLLFALGLLAKPMLVTLPFVLLLLDYWPLNRVSTLRSPPSAILLQRTGATEDGRNAERGVRNLKTLLAEKIPFFILSAASCVVTFLAQQHGGAVASLELIPLSMRLEHIAPAYGAYLLKLFWPVDLCVFYPLLPVHLVAATVAGAVLILISVAAWRVRQQAPYALVGWLWFLGTLVPVIGLVQVGSAAMADRYAYFPSIGIFLAVALGARDLARRLDVPRAIVTAAAGAVLAACLLLTHLQLRYWASSISLFSHAIAVNRNNDTAHLNLGVALGEIGNQTAAEHEYRLTLGINPNRVEARNNLATLLCESGDVEGALTELQEALRLNPKYTPAVANLGILYSKEKQFDQALQQFEEAARLTPDDWRPPYLKGQTLLRQGRDPEAIAALRQALQLYPNNPQILTFLAQVLACDEDPQIRDGQTAGVMAARAVALTGGVQPVMLDVLAMTYAEQEHFSDAQHAVQTAIEMAKLFKQTNELATFRQQLQLYQNHLPCRPSFTNPPAITP